MSNIYFTAPSVSAALLFIDKINRLTGIDVSMSNALIDTRDVDCIRSSKFIYIPFDERIGHISIPANNRYYDMMDMLSRMETLGICRKIHIEKLIP